MNRQIIIDNGKRNSTELVPLITGVEQCEHGHTFGPAIREYYLIHYCVSGRGTIEDKYGLHTVGPGSFFLIRPGEVTVYKADDTDPWKYIWIGFFGNEAKRLDGLATVTKYPYDTFFQIERSVCDKIDTPEIYVSHIYEMLHYLFSRRQPDSNVVERVKNYIMYNYMSPLSVEAVAEKEGLNRRYLSRIFKEKYGMSIKEFIVNIRCAKAAEFLDNGYSVTECAFMSGYSDVFAFSKMFRKVMGTSPTEWKKRQKNSL